MHTNSVITNTPPQSCGKIPTRLALCLMNALGPKDLVNVSTLRSLHGICINRKTPTSTLSHAYLKSKATCFNLEWQMGLEARKVAPWLFDLKHIGLGN